MKKVNNTQNSDPFKDMTLSEIIFAEAGKNIKEAERMRGGDSEVEDSEIMAYQAHTEFIKVLVSFYHYLYRGKEG